MPKQVIIPPGTTAPIAPFVPGTLADGVIYVSGTLPFDKQNNVVHIGDPKAQTRHVLETIKCVIETAGGSMAQAASATRRILVGMSPLISSCASVIGSPTL